MTAFDNLQHLLAYLICIVMNNPATADLPIGPDYKTHNKLRVKIARYRRVGDGEALIHTPE